MIHNLVIDGSVAYNDIDDATLEELMEDIALELRYRAIIKEQALEAYVDKEVIHDDK